MDARVPGALHLFYQNVWGLPVLSPDLDARLGLVERLIDSRRFDVLVLTEVWRARDRRRLERAGRGVYRSVSFASGPECPLYGGVWGPGLLVLSRLPVGERFFHAFPIGGFPHSLLGGDFWGGKGVGLVRLRAGDCPIDLYVTHLHASYAPAHQDYLETLELLDFVRATARSPFCLLAGDINWEEGSWGHRLLQVHLEDMHLALYPESSRAERVTMGGPDSDYCHEEQRLDYLFFRGSGWRPEAMNVERLRLDVRGRSTALSDHFGLSCVLLTDLSCAAPPSPLLSPLLRRREESQLRVECRQSLAEELHRLDCAIHNHRLQSVLTVALGGAAFATSQPSFVPLALLAYLALTLYFGAALLPFLRVQYTHIDRGLASHEQEEEEEEKGTKAEGRGIAL